MASTPSLSISSAALRRILIGVSVVTKTSKENAKLLDEWVFSRRSSDSDVFELSVEIWQDAIASLELEEYRQIASLALGITLLREKSRAGIAVTPTELGLAWSLIHAALASNLFSRCEAFRTILGYRAVPLCILAKDDGSLDETFSLHAWMPDQQRKDPDFTISSPGSFAQSWILAGEVKHQPYEVEYVLDEIPATHKEHTLRYDVDLHTPGIRCTENSGALVRTKALKPAFYTADMSYTVSESLFQTMEIAQNVLHAIIVFVDSRGMPMIDPKVLRPKDAEAVSKDSIKDCTNLKPAMIASMVNAARSWDLYMVQGKQHIAHSELELALRAFQGALNVSSAVELFPNAVDYRHSAMGMLGYTNRLFGRYSQAKEIMESALSEMGPTMERVSISGELGVVYHHMGLIEDAKHAFEVQYETAKQLDFKRAMCRAIGNLGMVNYQLSQENSYQDSDALLKLAIVQLTERVTTARQIKEEDSLASLADPAKALRRRKQAVAWELIGLSRLSLCHTATDNLKEAIAVAAEGELLARTIADATVHAVSQFFYGRALLKNGQHEKALEQFNPPDHKSTPAIALCQEPSEENRQYLRELVNAGADMDLVDEHGYSTLDYAVFAGDTEAEAILLEGLQRIDRYKDAADDLTNRRAEALLRKGYRELFQEKLRPVLLLGGGEYSLQMLRRAYAQALAEDENKRQLFDELKFMLYSDFINFGRLPRSSDGLVQAIKSGDDVTNFIIFFSYRWIGKAFGASFPDDAKNTQYQRMIRAAEEFLLLHPNVDRENLGIWMDYACVDQDNPMQGVSALPMIIAQCNAVISLVDDKYHSRAWCSVEALMIQTLKKSYGIHLWYEHQLSQEQNGDDAVEIFLEGSIDLLISMEKKDLTFESDRPKVLFLERQSKLLNWT